ncbi:class I adenylate-forming enzyme family protein [Pseudonocardia xishanensis]|uniref:Class I adenylate-forming enzyme family protein n=1 Tax=Pseudonocardia xishanensis TaxID=630995 RepID=A0ABP8RCT7_9PSEU
MSQLEEPMSPSAGPARGTSPGWPEVTTIGGLLVRAAAAAPDRAAIVFPDRRVTYAELLDRARTMARGLVGLGLGRGDHVGLLATNGVEFVEALFGISLIGGVIVPLNARHRADELGYIVSHGDLAAVLTTAAPGQYTDFAELLRGGLPGLADAPDAAGLALDSAPALRAAVLLSGEQAPGFLPRSRFDEIAAATPPAAVDALAARVRVRDTGVILFTSGTTANPKGCMLSHEAMTRGPVERARYRLGTGDADVSWSAGPLFHVATLGPFLGSVGTAGTFLSDSHFDPGRALDLLTREGVTVAFPWFPAVMQPVLDHPDFDPAALPALRSLFLIGPSVLLERVQAAFPGCELVAACGMTETAGIYAISGPDDSQELRATAQGAACPGIEIRIIDMFTGEDLADSGVPGEILVRGYNVMEGYYKDPEKTAETLDGQGWLHTGDLYSWTPEGHVAFHGRLKDMLKVGGENVAAVEIESFLARHPAVEWAEVIGVPDPRLDEVPVAFVELKAGQAATAEDLIAFCRGRIARFKIPREIHFLGPGEWPMSATKINKRGLRALLDSQTH